MSLQWLQLDRAHNIYNELVEAMIKNKLFAVAITVAAIISISPATFSATWR